MAASFGQSWVSLGADKWWQAEKVPECRSELALSEQKSSYEARQKLKDGREVKGFLTWSLWWRSKGVVWPAQTVLLLLSEDSPEKPTTGTVLTLAQLPLLQICTYARAFSSLRSFHYRSLRCFFFDTCPLRGYIPCTSRDMILLSVYIFVPVYFSAFFSFLFVACPFGLKISIYTIILLLIGVSFEASTWNYLESYMDTSK